MTEEKKTVFETLSKIDVSKHVEKKMNLSYLSWAWCWQTLKTIYPDTPVPKITKYKEMLLTKNGYELTDREVPYLTTPTGTMVEVTVSIKGVDYTQSLYVMDNRNKVVVNPTIGQINKTIQRCTVKAIAMAGLGLNLYAGEDLPMGDISEQDKKKAEQKRKQSEQKARLQTVLGEYRELLPKVAEAYETTTGEIEEQVKQTAESEIKNFDKMPAINRGARMNNILKNMLSQKGATEQGDLLSEV
ncbi:MAG: DUF1071 domain-containing protein [Limosilactobacillus reuteri]|nr:DUF1071 domain-containing protein [Limosilactobacillus reuteri]